MGRTFKPEAVKLGLWAPFIARERIHEITIWPGLEPLQADLMTYRPDGHEMDPMPPAQFQRVITGDLNWATDSIKKAKEGYHGSRHFRRFTHSQRRLYGAYRQLLPQKPFPLCVEQTGLRGGAVHDLGHPGSTFFATSLHGPASWLRPELGDQVSVEWATCVEVDRVYRQQGLNPPQRLFVTLLILATTYGQNEKIGQQLGLERFQAVTWLDWCMRVADIAPIDEFVSGVEEDVQALFDAVPSRKPPQTRVELFLSRYGFFKYGLHQMDQLDTTAGAHLTNHIGMRQQVLQRLHAYRQIEAGQDPVGQALLDNALYEHGIEYEK